MAQWVKSKNKAVVLSVDKTVTVGERVDRAPCQQRVRFRRQISASALSARRAQVLLQRGVRADRVHHAAQLPARGDRELLRQPEEGDRRLLGRAERRHRRVVRLPLLVQAGRLQVAVPEGRMRSWFRAATAPIG